MKRFKTINIQDLKTRGANVLDKTQTSYLIVNSKVEYAIVPAEEYDILLDIVEELEDIKSIEERKDEDVLSEEEFLSELGDSR